MSANEEKRIFTEAIVIADEAERNSYLLQACGGDELLLSSVQDLLDGHFSDDQFMVRPGLGQSLNIGTADDEVGQRIGPYLLLNCLGEGGFGVVYRARQESVGRDVALKVLRHGLLSQKARARFELERQALAMMDHSNIASVFDAATTTDGRLYFALELVDGPPITQYCQHKELSIEARCGLFRKVCEAVQHAHQNGVIHRDIKPTNVLIAEVDGQPVPKVIDFGIAKLADRDVANTITRSFELVGTPAYMSPEQTRAEKRNVDTRSDVYSLGVLLYEMLTGTTPFADRDLRESGVEEMCRIVREVIPAKPSTRARQLGPPTPSSRSIRTDLDWVVMKCLEKEPSRRYESAGALSQDIDRFVDFMPVLAGAPSPLYRLKRNLHRHRFAAVGAMAILATVLWGATSSYLSFQRTKKANLLLDEQLRATELEKEHNRSLLYLSDMSSALEAWKTDANVDRVAKLLKRHIPVPGQTDLRQFEWHHLQRLVRHYQSFTNVQHDVAVYDMSFSADSKRLVVAASLGGAYAWDLSNEVPTQTDHIEGMLLALDHAKSANFAVAGGFGPLGAARVWTPNSNRDQVKSKFQTQGEILGIAVSPTSSSFAAASADGRLVVWDLEADSIVFEGQVHPNPSGNQCWHLNYSSDGTMLACGTYTNPSSVFIDSKTGEKIQPLKSTTAREWCFVFDPNANRNLIASGSLDGDIKLYRVTPEGGETIFQFRAHHGLIRDLAFSPDGRWIASCRNDGTVQLFDVRRRQRAVTLRGHSNWVRKVAFSPDGKVLASLGSDSNIKIWNVSEILEQPQRIVLPKGDYYDAEFLSENSVAIAAASASIEVVDLIAGEITNHFEMPPTTERVEQDNIRFIQVDFARASGLLIASTFDGRVAAWKTSDGSLLWRSPGTGSPAFGLALSADGKRVATSADGQVRLANAGTGESEKELDRSPIPTEGLSMSSDGRWLAVGCFDSNVRVWSTETWKRVELKGHRGIGHGVAFAPSQNVLATGAEDGRVLLWRIDEDGQDGFTCNRHDLI